MKPSPNSSATSSAGLQACAPCSRRAFLSSPVALAALTTLFSRDSPPPALPGLPPFPPTAKRVIYLFQSGGPSQMELFDYKPRLTEFQGTDLPPSIRAGQRLTEM